VDESGGPLDESPSVMYRQGALRFGDLWTASPRMMLCVQTAQSIARLEMDVVILGETGTGKNLLAQAIHNASPRRAGPFLEFNTASIPRALAENELFGHEVGAYTGAERQHPGLFEQANGGTLFLDEIGNMPPELQAKILTSVERKKVRRLGGREETECDVRLLCATNTDVEEAMATGALRKDLYYRLGRCVLHVPSLRERQEDIPLLAERFVALDNASYNRTVERIAPACMLRLLEYPWPGNVRELRAKISFAVAICEGTELLPVHVFPETAARPVAGSGCPAPGGAAAGDDVSLASVERRHIAKVLAMTGWNIAQSSRLLGITRPTLRDKIARYGLRKPGEAVPRAGERRG